MRRNDRAQSDLEGRARVYKLSLTLDGEITIEAFRDALDSFVDVLRQVDRSISGTRSIRWKLADLRRASPATLTWVGEPRRLKGVDTTAMPVVVGESILAGLEQLEWGRGRPRGFTDDALDAMKRLVSLKRDEVITSVVVSGQASDSEAAPRTLALTERVVAAVNDLIGPKYTALTSVEGRLEAINAHGGLFFNVYDSAWGGRVRCDFPESLKEDALKAFDQRVLVHGVVKTDAAGHPRHVRVERLERLPLRKELPQSLRGIDRDYTGGLTSSEYLKKRWSEAEDA